ncbi:MAG: TetR/AcrR family transcriptional regulator, partial [Steroidobacteraceae bacterium]
AAERFRVHGINGIGVADLMKGAGLTHGGFYTHFDSKDALVTEAIEAALDQTLSTLQDAATKAGRRKKSKAVREEYLSIAHRDNPQVGCCIAALGDDIARLDANAKRAFEQNVEKLLELLSDDGERKRTETIRELCRMVGALVISRAVRSDAVSKEVLEACR